MADSNTRPSRPGPVPGRQRSSPGAGRRTGRGSAFAQDDRFYRDLVRGLRNGVIAITRDGRIAVMNDIAYGILGLKPRASDIGRPCAEVLRQHHDIVRMLAGAFELSHLPNRAELRLKTSGKVIGYTLSLIRDARQRVEGATLFFKDLTRVEELEERERLRDRLAALGEMAAAIAHEVKNPLAGIEVMAGILKRQVPDSADAQAILKDIITEAKMANAIVLEVLEFVRPIRLQVEPAAVADVVRDALVMAERQVPRGSIDVRLTLADGLPRVQADPHQLRQLFTNLLTNAFEALAGRGTVDITASVAAAEDDHGSEGTQGGPLMIVEVSDTGPGVPTDVTDRIFNPFFTTKPRGSGLGLAIVRKIVDAHDGRIDVRSQPGGGTRFCVTLPLGGGHDWFASS